MSAVCQRRRTRRLGVLAAAVPLLAHACAEPAPDATARAGAVPEIARAARPAAPVLFIGMDGADWQQLDGAVASGLMPNLERLLREGYSGVLETEQPPLSPLLWTTMMTGRGPLEHGILDFVRRAPGSGRKEPITSDERRVPAVWNAFSMAGRSVAVFGLWATYPAERVNGILVSDRFFAFQHVEQATPPGVVFPPEEEPWARAVLASVEREVDPPALRAYLPWLDEQGFQALASLADPYADPVGALRRLLVETRVYDRLASAWCERARPDLLVLYVQGTDAIGHVFAPYTPPRLPWVSELDYERFRGVADVYFAELDAILGRYLALAERLGAVLFLASDHGFFWGEGRPRELSSTATATAGKWHRNEGIYLLWGRGIAAAPGRPGRGGIAQVAATLLALGGLPAPAGSPLRPLPGAGEPAAAVVDYARYFEPVAPLAVPEDAAGAEEQLAELRALGYLAGSPEGATAAASTGGSTRSAGSHNNEGLILESLGRRAEAIAAYRRARALEPALLSATWNLSNLLFQIGGEHDDQLDERLEEADALALTALAAGLPSGGRLIVERARAYHRSGRSARVLPLLDSAVAVLPAEPELRLFRGRYRIDAGDCAGAAADFGGAIDLEPGDAVAHASLGLARLCLGDVASARRALEHSLELDPEQPEVVRALARLP